MIKPAHRKYFIFMEGSIENYKSQLHLLNNMIISIRDNKLVVIILT